jgi:hypothetical protein
MAAFMQLETLEQQARITFMLAQLGVNNPLGLDLVERLLAMRQTMGLNPPEANFAYCPDCAVYHQPGLHVR